LIMDFSDERKKINKGMKLNKTVATTASCSKLRSTCHRRQGTEIYFQYA
jgi:hypothetical protein